jgi:hypothetical protein
LEQPDLNQSRHSCPEEPTKEVAVATEESPKRERKIHFETKTMAEVYAQQGHNRIALEIYKRVFQKDPEDTEAQRRISELETKFSSRRERVAKSGGDAT